MAILVKQAVEPIGLLLASRCAIRGQIDILLAGVQGASKHCRRYGLVGKREKKHRASKKIPDAFHSILGLLVTDLTNGPTHIGRIIEDFLV